MKTRCAVRAIATLTGLLATSLGEAATICVSPAGGLCQTTIQAAVALASPGDIVRVNPGTYYGGVSVPPGKDGLQIVGASRLTTILDPSAYSDQGLPGSPIGIEILSRDVQVKNLKIRNGDDGIVSSGRGTIIQGVSLDGLNSVGVRTTGWYSQVSMSEVRNSNIGIQTLGFGTVVRGNVVTGTNVGIDLGADGNQAIGNQLRTGMFGIRAIGDGSVVKTNQVSHQWLSGIDVAGSSPTIQGNKVYGGGQAEGIVATCTNCFGGIVSSNVVTDASGYGILVAADDVGLVVQGNTLLRAGVGISVNGFGVLVQNNKATDIGKDTHGDCFEVFGSMHTIARNTATGCSNAGIYVNGDDNYLDRNVTSGTFENGITIDGFDDGIVFFARNSLVDNKVNSSAAQGIAIINDADLTEVTSNLAMKNRVDFCNDGTNTVVSGNTFPTVADTPGLDCPIAH